MARRRPLLAAGPVPIGGGSTDTSPPRARRPLRLGAMVGRAQGCPPVDGMYGVQSELVFTTPVDQHRSTTTRAMA